MSKTAMIRARVEPELKEEVESLFDRLGVTSSEAINMFYKQVQLYRGFPFPVRIPNAATRKALHDTAQGKNLSEWMTVEEMKRRLA